MLQEHVADDGTFQPSILVARSPPEADQMQSGTYYRNCSTPVARCQRACGKISGSPCWPQDVVCKSIDSDAIPMLVVLGSGFLGGVLNSGGDKPPARYLKRFAAHGATEMMGVFNPLVSNRSRVSQPLCTHSCAVESMFGRATGKGYVLPPHLLSRQVCEVQVPLTQKGRCILREEASKLSGQGREQAAL